jgi:nucleoside phosphorylase
MEKVLIVTVTKIEAQTVLELFSKASGQPWKRLIRNNKTYYALGNVGNANVFMVQSEMGASTPGGALLTIRNAIDTLSPSAVIMVGIAFGVNSAKQNLGDILVSRQIATYEPQKIKGQNKLIPRGDRVTASIDLLDRFRSAELDWRGASVHFGLMLSGEKLITDVSFRNQLLKFEPEAVGGEMEGTGLYVASSESKVSWILVKAICDWADGSKNDEFQTIAATNAVSFVVHALQRVSFTEIQESAETAEAHLKPYAQSVLPIDASIVRIYGKQNLPIGVGFLVDERHIFTCAHVIVSALGVSADEALSKEIRLDFPLIATRPYFASITFLDSDSDIAVLELPQYVEKSRPAPLAYESNLWGRPFRAFGFPAGRELGVWTGGIIRGPNAQGWVQIEGKEVGYRIQAGFSGSPVWDENTNAIVGMIVATDTDSSVRVALFIPITKIVELFPISISQPTEVSTKLDKRRLQIFLCHASADKTTVRELYRRLLHDGYKPWFDEEDLIPGQRWEIEIPKAVRASDAIVICLSQKSISKSGYVQKEIKFALDVADEKPENIIFVIPCRLEECEVPERLKPFHWVNLFQENGYSGLLRALESVSLETSA